MTTFVLRQSLERCQRMYVNYIVLQNRPIWTYLSRGGGGGEVDLFEYLTVFVRDKQISNSIGVTLRLLFIM